MQPHMLSRWLELSVHLQITAASLLGDMNLAMAFETFIVFFILLAWSIFAYSTSEAGSCVSWLAASHVRLGGTNAAGMGGILKAAISRPAPTFTGCARGTE